MATDKKRVMAYIEEIDKEKIEKIAKIDGRSVSNYITKLIINDIQIYEKEHGTIEITKQKN